MYTNLGPVVQKNAQLRLEILHSSKNSSTKLIVWDYTYMKLNIKFLLFILIPQFNKCQEWIAKEDFGLNHMFFCKMCPPFQQNINEFTATVT